jgi:2-polyprenyl-6-methoxyphenol hydroxylase-like FAD-dependent oxidoreductase
MAALRHVGIVGAGLAGLSAALAAAQAGCRVDVFEARSDAAAPASHVDVVPNLLRDLIGLGLGAACVRRGFPYQGFAVVDDHGRPQFEVPTPHLAGAPWPASLGICYADLLDLLREATVAQGVRLHTGRTVRDTCEGGEGGAICTDDGARHRVDLVLVASGDALPLVAGRPLPAVPESAVQQLWCHALLPRPRGLECSTWVLGRDMLRALLVPVGARRVGVALMRAAEAPNDSAALREALSARGPLLRGLAGHWRDDLPVLRRPVRTGVLPGDWHSAGVLRIGRSAHHLPPHMGQAGAQVVEDACVLGDLLRTGLDRSALLSAFMARRGARARSVHQLAAQAARWQLKPEADTDLPALAARLQHLVAEPA